VLLARLLARQQRGSEHDPLKLLLSGRDPGEISRLLHYFRAISEARAQSIANLRANQQRAKELAEAAQEQQQRLTALANDEVAQRAILEQERRQQAQVLARVGADIRRQQRELDHLKRDELRLAGLIDRLAELARSRTRSRPDATALLRPTPPGDAPSAAVTDQLPDAPAARETSGGLRRGTLSLPVRGELTSRFGAPRDGGGTTWKGWFIRCPTGQEVRSIAAGQVVYADWLRGFGNLLIVDHGDGYMSLYGNNDALLATVGAIVREGEAVAQAGASGGSAEPGVYFEISHQGKAVDPTPWIGR
jgi:septal ring factor EnvC (AmiA/AmiB activator)